MNAEVELVSNPEGPSFSLALRTDLTLPELYALTDELDAMALSGEYYNPEAIRDSIYTVLERIIKLETPFNTQQLVGEFTS